MDLDLAELVGRTLRPDRPRLAEARAAVAGIADAREAWEVLAVRGLIPAAWVDDPLRRFDGKCGRCKGFGVLTDVDDPVLGSPWCSSCSGGEVVRSPHPPNVRAAVAIAADAACVATVEALARELVERLRPWAPLQPWACLEASHLLWRVRPEIAGEFISPPFEMFEMPFRLAAEALMLARAWQARDTRRDGGLASSGIVDGAVRFAACCAQGRLVPRLPSEYQSLATALDGSHPLAGRPFASLPNPFEPLLAIWRAGYALESIAEDAFVLVAPEVDDHDA